MKTTLSAFLLLTLLPAMALVADDDLGILRPDQATRELGYLPMDDGIELAYVVWRPRQEGRFPVLLSNSPYLGGGIDLENHEEFSSAALEYLRHGYAFVGVSIRGTGCSEGGFDLLSERNARDGAAAVEWAGSQSWSTGAVGLVGNSYEGITQYPVAARHPRYLKAMAAGASVGDAYLDAAYPGGIFNSSFFAFWAYDVQPMAAAWGASSRVEAGDDRCTAIRAKQPGNGVFRATRTHPHRDAWWQARDLTAMATAIEVPVFIAQAWQDQQVAVRGATRLFESLKTPKKMILGNGDHGFYGLPTVMAERLRWYDHWLKGEDTGVDGDAPVSVWFEHRPVDGEWRAGWTRDFDDWPPPESEPRTLHLTAEGRLRRAAASTGKASGERHYIYPAGSELIGSAAEFAIAPASFGSLSYRSEPAATDITILGSPELVLYLSSERSDTDLMVALHDIDRDGRVQYLQRGFLRASHAAKLVTAEGGDAGVERNHQRPAPLRPESVYELRVELQPLGHVLRPGHALELVVLAPNPLPQPNWGLAAVMLPGRNTVYHSEQHPSRLLVPVLPGAGAEAAAPECGSLPMQPCRAPAPESSEQPGPPALSTRRKV